MGLHVMPPRHMSDTIDPTERALAADELPVAIWLGRVPSGEVVYTNAAFREVLGIDPPSPTSRGGFVGAHGVHTLTGAPYPAEQMPFERVLATRTTVTVEDLVLHRRDGRRVNLRVFAKPIFDRDGNLTHVLEAFTDITREVEAERARIETERALARSLRHESIGQLIAGIAHDFNNLLTVTKLSVTWLRATETTVTERQQALEQVDLVTDSAIELIRRLLRFAQRERQVMVPTSVEAAASAVVEMARLTLDPMLTIETDFAAGDALVMGDASQLEQLVLNLVLNARDATSGVGNVVVRTRLAEATSVEGPRVLIEVSDNGCGIDPSMRDRIFEPYFTTKTQGPVKGTGLGLAVVHGIVRTHGGTIEVVDDSRQGATMRVALPQAPASPAATGTPREPNPKSSRRERLVLVIDHEPLARAATAASLRGLGLSVCDAPDGSTGLGIAAVRHHELAGVILDVVMPGLRGRDVVLGLRRLRPDMPVLLVTGSADTDELREIRDLGVAGVLSKPYDDKELAIALEQAGVL
jgi:signal transduction histidine kinase